MMEAMETRTIPFTQLQPIHVTQDDGIVNPPKQARRYCGVRGKIVLAAILLILVIIIFTAAIVMVAVAHADKDEINSGPDEEASTSRVPVSDRVKCPFKSRQSCTAGGCLYSNDEKGSADSSIPSCFYPKNYYTLSNTSSWTDNTSSSSKNIIDVQIGDKKADSLSLTIGSSQKSVKKKSKRATSDALYNVRFDHTDFGFCVERKDTSEVLFNLKGKTSLNILKYFVSLTIAVPKDSKAFGLGNFKQYAKKFDDKVYTIWSRQEEEAAHPFILLQSSSGRASAIYVDSTYPMDIQLQKGFKITITALTTELKIRFFVGPTTADVIKQYWSNIKKPSRPPYWGMGHFYGSESVSTYADLVELFKNHSKLANDMPIEGIILPGAMNQDHQPFTIDDKILTYLKDRYDKNGTSYILTVPPTITKSSGGSNNTWFMHTAGVDQKVFLTNGDNTPISGMYANKMSLYPDFTASNTNSWWQKNISAISSHGRYGYHMHKNTPYNQVNGSIGVCDDIYSAIGLATDILNIPNLEANTICISAKGKRGNQLKKHNRFGYDQAKVTYSTLTPWSVSVRPYLLSDQTSPGIGKYSGHFHDSNVDTLVGLKYAMTELVTHSLLGVPFTGPNLCTKEMSTVDMCVRWYYLSVISPLSWSLSNQMPHIFNTTVAKTITRTLQFRQRLLPYHYDAFYKAETSSKVPIRFLSFDYPTDETATLYQTEVLVGEGLLYCPVLRPGEKSRVCYLPNGTWCNWIDGACYEAAQTTQVYTENAPESFTFLKGGSAIVTQKSARTVKTSRTQMVRLIVVLDSDGAANHTQFFDDGETANTLYSKYYSLVNYEVANNTLTVKHLHNGYLGSSMKVKYEKIYIYGLKKKVTKLKLNNEEVKMNCLMGGETAFFKIIISSTNVDISLNQQFTFTWEF